MRYASEEKLEIIRLVENSHLGVKRTLDKLGVALLFKLYLQSLFVGRIK